MKTAQGKMHSHETERDPDVRTSSGSDNRGRGKRAALFQGPFRKGIERPGAGCSLPATPAPRAPQAHPAPCALRMDGRGRACSEWYAFWIARSQGRLNAGEQSKCEDGIKRGSLQKRKRATGWAWIGMWRDAHGRRLSRNLGKYPVVSKAEAQARLEGKMAEVNQGAEISPKTT